MQTAILAVFLMVGFAQAQTPSPSKAANATTKGDNADNLFPAHKRTGTVGLIRGVLKRIDPIYDQLVIHTFGDGDVRVAFDGQTKLLAENGDAHLSNIRAGSVVSVDTVMDEGKLFASIVRIGTASPAELNGQVVRYDPSKSELVVRDPINPGAISLRITTSTRVVNQRNTGPANETLSAGMLVRVRYSGIQNAADEVEILAAPGDSFTFEGRIIAVDLRTRIVSLSNDTDQSLRELAFGGLDDSSAGLLREGAQVSIQAVFDGDRYNVRTVTAVPKAP